MFSNRLEQILLANKLKQSTAAVNVFKVTTPTLPSLSQGINGEVEVGAPAPKATGQLKLRRKVGNNPAAELMDRNSEGSRVFSVFCAPVCAGRVRVHSYMR